MTPPAIEIADVIRAYDSTELQGEGLRVSSEQSKVLNALAVCRTAALGGHHLQCSDCGHRDISYNSCRNRHCPKCQGAARRQWLEARKNDLLPVQYFHVVFTLPQEVASIALQNRRRIYNLLIRCAAETLQQTAADSTHLGGQLGFVIVLHTWGQKLQHHPHIHCLVPGGALSPDATRWISTPPGFFLPVDVLSPRYRGKFLHHLRQAFRHHQLFLQGSLSSLSRPQAFHALLSQLYRKDWVVYAKRPFAGPEQVLEYLARYTHRVAIANHRLLELDNGHVTFSWKDYAHGNRRRRLTLTVLEFLRRFLLHVLPTGFTRIRHYGFLANRSRQQKLAVCRKLLQEKPPPTSDHPQPCDHTRVPTPASKAPARPCPVCRLGSLVPIARIPAPRSRSPPLRGPP
jgi:hypothetical protein